MAKLRNIVGCILNEFTQAQHLSNNYAARLGRQYAENDLLRYFMIPNACANGLTFHLKFAVNSADEVETVTEIDYQRLIQFFGQLAVSLAETAITTVLYTSEGSIVAGLENYRKLKEKEEILKTDFHEYLSRVLRETLVKKAMDEVDGDGCPDPNKIFEISMEVIDREFFRHPDLNLSGDRSDEEYFGKIKESCSSFMNTLIRHSCKGINVLDTRQSEVLDIAVDAESLSRVAPENIQQVSFDVGLRNYQISRMDSETGSADRIIPANN